MKPALLVLVLLLSWTAAFSQQSTPAASTYVFAPAAACPISMEAKQSGATDLVRVRKGEDPRQDTISKPGQRVRLILAPVPDGGKIKGATITAHGLSAHGRLDNASGASKADLRRTMDITFGPGENGSLVAEIPLPGFTAVQSIKLEALEYADGSTRDFSGQKLCSVTPDPLMLIADR